MVQPRLEILRQTINSGGIHSLSADEAGHQDDYVQLSAYSTQDGDTGLPSLPHSRACNET